jgi:hypothetical protein
MSMPTLPPTQTEDMVHKFGYPISEVRWYARVLRDLALNNPSELLNCRTKYGQA